MNIFIIPSWYPNNTSPNSGIFVRDQADTLSAIYPTIRVIVSTWGHDDGYITPRKPSTLWKSLKWNLAQQNNQILNRSGVWEVFNPCLQWSHKLPFGGIQRLIAVNRHNLKLALLKFGKIDLIHAHVSYPGGFVALSLAREFSIPFVVTEHMGPFPLPLYIKKNGQPRDEIIEVFRNAECGIAVSPSLASRIASFGLPKPLVIPNVVDESRFFPGDSLGTKFIFFTLCGLSDQKGIDHLLKAIALLNPSPDRFEFCIGGDGPMRDKLKAMAKEFKIEDCIRWLGFVSRNQAPALFRDCHAYVMPSLYETFGVVFVEAIASGKPVIATRCGGPEFIVNKDNGRLVDVGDIVGLANMMDWMTKHWNCFDPIIIRKDFEQRFSRTIVATQLKSLYESIVKN